MVVVRTIFSLLRFKNWLWDKLGWTSLPPLREFVYMEEDTVISLVASTTGGITEQQTTGQKKRISSSITGSLGGNSAGVGSSVGATTEKSSEVVRQYVIQSNFKELYEMREDDLVIFDNPEIDREAPFAVSSSRGTGNDLPVSEGRKSQLERGNMVELDVELESAEVYEYYRVIKAFDDIFGTISSESELREELRAQEFSSEEISMVIELMEILMADLVPIIGTVQNYGVSEDGGVVVEKEWAEQNGLDYEELKVAGFVDEDNLWLEPTRVLFDKNEFTVYARVDSPRIQNEWMPMKLLDVVETVFPGMGEDIQNLPDAFDQAKPGRQESSNVRGRRAPIGYSVEEDLNEYINALDSEYDLEIEEEIKKQIVESVLDGTSGEELGIDDRMAILQEIEGVLEDRGFEFPIDAETRSDLISSLWSRDEVKLGEASSDGNGENYLEMNFIAIYW